VLDQVTLDFFATHVDDHIAVDLDALRKRLPGIGEIVLRRGRRGRRHSSRIAF